MRDWKILLALVVFAAPLVVYVGFFARYPISHDPTDWATFGNYIGGVYTVLVSFLAIYLTRHLKRRDEERNKARGAIGSIYEQVAKIDYQHVNINTVKKFLRLTKENELYIPSPLFDKLIDLYDDYVEAKDNPKKFNLQKEEEIKRQLKKLYDV